MRNFIAISTTIFGFIAVWALLWEFEQTYSKETPKPTNYVEVELNTQVDLPIKNLKKRPTLIHFFNPNCPCSKFNFEHFKYLTIKYADEANFIVATHISNGESFDLPQLQNEFSTQINIINDSSKELAESLGVYSTPQAVLLNSKSIICYRGNYNRARFCTDKKTNFVQLSLKAIINGNKIPFFDEIATKPYGCELPGNEI